MLIETFKSDNIDIKKPAAELLVKMGDITIKPLIYALDEEDVEVSDTVSEEQLVRDVFRELVGHIYNGITVSELSKILKDNFGILSRYCCDLIQRLKIELDMYCPDRKHLYFVEGNK